MKLGPIHSSLPGIFELTYSARGEWVDEVKLRTGFTHRGLEQKLEGARWSQSLLYVDRISPDLPYFYETLFCEAVEEISSIELPPRAKSIRRVLVQLNALESRLLHLGKVSRALGFLAGFHFFMRDRERILDLFELITGSRGNPNFFRFGGVARDISDGFVERLFSAIKEFNFRLKEYDRVFFDNPSIRSHLEEIYGDRPNPLQESRRKLEDDLVQLLLLLDEMESGDFFLFVYDSDLSVPSGESIRTILTPRGPAHLYLRSAGTVRPERVRLYTPSTELFRKIPEQLAGLHVHHVPLALHLLGFEIGEVDK